MREDLFSFETLERHIRTEATSERTRRGVTTERVAPALMLLGAAPVIVSAGLMQPTMTTMWISLSGLSIEVLGFAVFVFTNLGNLGQV